ncbi:hypothetical protein BSK52_03865 [Paenibacillus odorifer]|uniref:Uncharacterized protein n=1 Tax=Paenibacillus odorifer TaxID=189426 RepID=A0A1R0Y863_9BACL|nr:hypothetical protein BSK52_03865 [Paenibacillus odorifer]
MNHDYFKNVQQLSHEDDRRYLLLMRGLRIIHEERKQRSLLQKLKKSKHRLGKNIEAQGWVNPSKKIDRAQISPTVLVKTVSP